MPAISGNFGGLVAKIVKIALNCPPIVTKADWIDTLESAVAFLLKFIFLNGLAALLQSRIRQTEEQSQELQ